jgi:lysozyme family protein
MAKDSFSLCLAETLKWEGGWSNDPYDPGGPTMKGIIQRVYDGYRDARGLRRQTVRKITNRELEEIYRENYWKAVRGDELPDGVNLAVFDFGVNSGPSRAIRYLQAAVGVKQDGHLGAATLAAVDKADPVELIGKITAGRRRFIRQIKTYWRFGKGWERRCSGIEAAARAMAEGVARPVPRPSPEPQARAVDETKPASNSVVGTVVGAGGAAGGAILNEAAKGVVPPPDPAVTETITNIGLWQQVGQSVASFVRFVMASPLEVGAILAVIGLVWLAPRLLPYLWRRA